MDNKKMDNKKLESWGEAITLDGKKKDGQPFSQGQNFSPIVFHFKPNKYLIVADDKLKEWEEYFAENVGLRFDKNLVKGGGDDGARMMDMHESISGSNGDWDDCDYV